MLKGLSNEFKVGVLTIVSLFTLFMGYNFMIGRENIFNRGREFIIIYKNTQGLSVGTKVMLNGYKVGSLRSLSMNDNQQIVAVVEITSSMSIPKNSSIKIQSELLGGVSLRFLKGNSVVMAMPRDTLIASYSDDIFELINKQIVGVASSTDSLFNSLNVLLKKEELNLALNELPKIMRELSATIIDIRLQIETLGPSLNTSANNMAKFSTNLPEYDQKIREGFHHINALGTQIDTMQVDKLVVNLSKSLSQITVILDNLGEGKGSLGKLLNDDKLYNTLIKSNEEVQNIILDLKRYPEKYIPVPLSVKQRTKAKKKSNSDTAISH
ncbi:MAG: hypothetical protein CK532_01910 [Flavobacteriales bacterium]|nr:MAG: hypothetical protein CK532_01910 [Flavobacteriales bacterium]